MFRSRPQDLALTDIEAVVHEAWQEDASVEFKSTLPAKKGGVDLWIEGKGEVGDKARNEIVEEVIAFANAHGGTLLVGIEESKDKPSRAVAINPLPQCAELAERLRLKCRDVIEPQVPLLEVAGVPTEENGAGVVVFRVPQSRLAPHRHTATRECYVRRGDRSEKMTMREIQDLTLQVERGIAAIETTFQERCDEFGRKFGAFRRRHEPAVAVRVTLVPIVPLYVDSVHGNQNFMPPNRNFKAKDKQESFSIEADYGFGDSRPLLRGTQYVSNEDTQEFYREVYCNGTIEYVLVRKYDDDQTRCYDGIRPDDLLNKVCNAMCAAELFRRGVGAHAVEYGMEIEVRHSAERMRVLRLGERHGVHSLGNFPVEQMFPRYSVGAPELFPTLAALVARDFWHVVGIDRGSEPLVDFDSALTDLLDAN